MMRIVLALACAMVCAHALSEPVNHVDQMNKMLRASAAAAGRKLRDLPEQWFTEQKVDHFDPTNQDTFSTLYFVNDEHYKQGGPVFLYFNGEGPLQGGAVTGGYMVDLAETHGALIVSQETRYYGQSIPTPDLTVPNMRFHTIQQALADGAYFQAWFQKNVMETKYGASNETIWGIIGGSYSGALSAWYRQKYPHLVDFSWASSGVVNPVWEFDEYCPVIEHDMKEVPGCFSALVSIQSQLETMISTANGAAELQKMFKTCESAEYILANPEDFFFTVNGPWQGAGQYGYQDAFCADILNTTTGTPLQNLANNINSGLNADSPCNVLDWVSLNAVTTKPVPAGSDRSWFWQKCTEFGFFKTTKGSAIFGDISIDYFKSACAKAFDGQLPFPPESNQWVIDYFGGDKPQGEQIVFVDGTNDPWHPCSLQPRNTTANPERPALFTFEGSHCLDMMSPSPNDNESLRSNRQLIAKYVGNWLQEAQANAYPQPWEQNQAQG